LGKLATDQIYDFLHKFQAEENSEFHEFTDNSESPYNTSKFLCTYIDETSFATKPSLQQKKFTIMSLNIQSLPAKYADFLDFITECQLHNNSPDIICLQEIWNVLDVNLFPLPGYQPLICKTRINSSGGGVGIYVKTNIQFKILTELSIFQEKLFESVFIEISANSAQKIILGSVNRPNSKFSNLSLSEQFTQFYELYANILESCNDKKNETIILGDLNLDVLQFDLIPNVNKYIELLFANGFLQTVTRPTRITLNTATCIDHIITNKICNTYDITLVSSKISDHFPVIYTRDVAGPGTGTDPPAMASRNMSSNNLNKFKLTLGGLGWGGVLASAAAQPAYDNFSETFLPLFDLHFPITKTKFNKNIHKHEKWMTSGILTSRLTKLKLSKEHFSKPNPESLEKFKKFRNMYNKIVRASKKMYFDLELKANQSNLKQTWNILNTAIKKCKKSKIISSLTLNHIETRDPLIIANSFNKYFTTIAAEIATKINPADSPFNPPAPPPQYKFNMSAEPVTSNEITETLKQLAPKKTADMNGISMHLIKLLSPELIVPLKHIFNLSLSEGTVPSQLKIAKVIPVFKSGDCQDLNNYRPISLLPSISKVLEKIVCARLNVYLNNNSIINDNQFGFRKNFSTTHAMSHLVNKISNALNEKKHTVVIFCDLRKAFDTCNHTILFKKLAKYGICGLELEWFKSYLNDRKQFVQVGEAVSSERAIGIGVPQGSILGPILFLLYINDIPEFTKLLALLFADDTALVASDEDLERLALYINTELQKVCFYFRQMGLSLHPEKTKYIIFSNDKNINNKQFKLYVNNNNNTAADSQDPSLIYELERVKSTDNMPAIKYLGVYFDPLLTFKYHISQITSKIARALFTIRQVKNFLPPSALKTLYFALVHCHLTYATVIWSACSQSTLKQLITKQKMAIRTISSAKYNAHTEPLFKSLKILPLDKLIYQQKTEFMFCYAKNLLPKALAGSWQTVQERRNQDDVPNQRHLRNDHDLFVPRICSTMAGKLPLFTLPKCWNDLAPEFKGIGSKNSFKYKVKNHLLSQLSETSQCTRLFCPHCSIPPC
jgi:hypothetical protein